MVQYKHLLKNLHPIIGIEQPEFRTQHGTRLALTAILPFCINLIHNKFAPNFLLMDHRSKTAKMLTSESLVHRSRKLRF